MSLRVLSATGAAAALVSCGGEVKAPPSPDPCAAVVDELSCIAVRECLWLKQDACSAPEVAATGCYTAVRTSIDDPCSAKRMLTCPSGRTCALRIATPGYGGVLKDRCVPVATCVEVP